jgi:hypothetical protein
MWQVGHVAGWPCGRLVVWQVGHVAGWPCGRLAMWQVGHVAGWSCGRLVMWAGLHDRQVGHVGVGGVAVELGGAGRDGLEGAPADAEPRRVVLPQELALPGGGGGVGVGGGGG